MEEPEITARMRAVAAWWHERTGRHADYKACRKLGQLELSPDDLVAHMQRVADELRAAGDPLSSLSYFTSAVGIGRLRELEASSRRSQPQPRRGGITSLGELLAGYSAVRPMP